MYVKIFLILNQMRNSLKSIIIIIKFIWCSDEYFHSKLNGDVRCYRSLPDTSTLINRNARIRIHSKLEWGIRSYDFERQYFPNHCHSQDSISRNLRKNNVFLTFSPHRTSSFARRRGGAEKREEMRGSLRDLIYARCAPNNVVRFRGPLMVAAGALITTKYGPISLPGAGSVGSFRGFQPAGIL